MAEHGTERNLQSPRPTAGGSILPNWPAIILVILVTGWFFLGSWPFTAVEGDDLGIATGVLVLLRTGDVSHPLLYRYHPQAGTYWLTAAASHLTGWSPSEGLAVLSLVGGLVLWWGSAAYAIRLLPIPVLLALITPLFVQELWVASYFGNSTILAAGAAVLGLLLISLSTRRPVPTDRSGTRRALSAANLSAALGGVFLALATWIRFDAILLLPAIAWAAIGADSRRFFRLIPFAGSFVTFLAFLIICSGVRLTEVFAQGASHVLNFAQWRQSLISWLVWGSVGLVLLLVFGIRRLWTSKNWQELILASLGFFPFAAVYGWNLTTPKYLLYTVPFATRLACHGWLEVLSAYRIGRRLPLWIIAGILLLQFVGGPLTVITRLTGGNWIIAGTHDGPRRLEGLLWNPVDWHRTKDNIRSMWPALRSHVRTLLAAHESLMMLTDDWFSSRWVRLELLQLGFLPTDCRRHFAFIPVPGHCDYCEFSRPREAPPFAAADRRPLSVHKVACFETEWLERPDPPPLQWRELWATWKSTPNLTILWVSGRRSSPDEIRLAWRTLHLGNNVDVEPIVPGKTRPWLFRIRPATDPPVRPGEIAR